MPQCVRVLFQHDPPLRLAFPGAGPFEEAQYVQAHHREWLDNPEQGTVKLTDFLEVPLIDMPPKSLICFVGSN